MRFCDYSYVKTAAVSLIVDYGFQNGSFMDIVVPVCCVVVNFRAVQMVNMDFFHTDMLGSVKPQSEVSGTNIRGGSDSV